MELSPGHIHCVKWFESEALGEIGEVIKKKLEITFRNDRKYRNGKKAPDGIEIRFGNTRPTPEVREMLKAHGFRFSEKQTMWYAFDNEKSRELINQLEKTEVEVDTTQYEKRSFWKKIKSTKEFNDLRPYTEFMVTGQPPKFFFNKKLLLKTFGNPNTLIYKTGLSYKKYFNKIVGEDESENEKEETNEEETELDEIEAQAQLELLRLRVERQKRKKNNVDGVEDIDPEKLQGFRQKAWTLQGYGDVLDFK